MNHGNKIRLGCRNYDGTSAIIRGLVSIPGVEVEITEMKSVAGMFTAMFNGEVDVSEMSLAELIYYTSRDESDFVGIPVFPSRMFRHGFIFVRKSANIKGPEDLRGKDIGFLRWVQTASVWIRGILGDDYDITPRNSRWHVASLHHWDKVQTSESVKMPDGSTIHMLEGDGRTASDRATRALSEGRLDALGITESQLPRLLADPNVKRLFENYKEVEIRYFKKTRIFPIMHVLAMRKTLAQAFPDLPEKLFTLFCRAKQWGKEWQRTIPSLVMAWKNHTLEQEREIFHGDPCPYGLEENRHVINRFLHYCEGQGISDRKVSPEELFVESTWKLVEG